MSSKPPDNTNQYLTFKLSDEVFGLAIDKVREVLDFESLTKVPQTLEFMRGVINLRGSVVPVVDMRMKFGMEKIEKTVNACIIIVEVAMAEDTIIVGALADSVQEVLDLESSQIEPAPRIGSQLETEFICGMGKQGEQFVILLDIDRLFSPEELDTVPLPVEDAV